MTVCEQETLPFSDLGSRQVGVDFSGGTLSSDGGALLLRQTDRGLGLTRQLARCFVDTRDARWVDHSVEQLQRLYGLALGYEDLNDHQTLRRDPLMAIGELTNRQRGINRGSGWREHLGLSRPADPRPGIVCQ
jgi:hypothetical protein